VNIYRKFNECAQLGWEKNIWLKVNDCFLLYFSCSDNTSFKESTKSNLNDQRLPETVPFKKRSFSPTQMKREFLQYHFQPTLNIGNTKQDNKKIMFGSESVRPRFSVKETRKIFEQIA
jgi:hypothetical protein